MNTERQTRTISFRFFVALWVLALLLPVVVYWWSFEGAVFVGIVVPLLWLSYMPCTCMGGAFVAFPMALMQVASMLSWLVSGIKRYLG